MRGGNRGRRLQDYVCEQGGEFCPKIINSLDTYFFHKIWCHLTYLPLKLVKIGGSSHT